MESEKRRREPSLPAHVDFDAEDKEFLIRQRKGHSSYKFEECDSEPRTPSRGHGTLRDPSMLCGTNHDHSTGHRSRRRDISQGRKAKQLCRQVAITLDLVLSGECHDPDLQALRVVAVEPAPNSSRLRVTLAVELPAREFNPQRVEEQLARQSGRLRAKVADAICRKRTPSLVFQVLAPTAGGPAME